MAALLGDAGFSAGLAAVPRRPQRNARTGDKNNIYIIGHAAFGQGLMQLERYEFEDAATSLEGAWTVWKDVFLGAPTKPMPIDPASSDEEEESESSSSESESETDSSSDHLPERPRRIGANEAAAKAFFKAKSCSNEGAGVGATFAPAGPARKTSSGSGSDGGSKPRRRRPPKGFADDGEPAPPPEQEDRMGVWPPVPTVDIFAEALTDALILRVTRATEEEALACALEVQQQIMATAGQESPSDDDDDDESEDEELSTVAYTQRAYKRDVQIMMKEPSEGTTPQPSGEFASSKETKTYETAGAKPQFHHYRRLMRGLCHCYVRLRRWVDLDRFIEEALPYFQEVRSLQRKKVPQFRNKDREELWITLQMQRAAACILIGRDHYEKADKFLQNVRRVQPKDRVLQRTVDSIEFLREQLKDVSAGDSAANTEDTLLTQALLAMRW